jgi:hypothetical protein
VKLEAAVYAETLVTNHQMNPKNHNLNLHNRKNFETMMNLRASKWVKLPLFLP